MWRNETVDWRFIGNLQYGGEGLRGIGRRSNRSMTGAAFVLVGGSRMMKRYWPAVSPLHALIRKNPYGVTPEKARSTTGRV